MPSQAASLRLKVFQAQAGHPPRVHDTRVTALLGCTALTPDARTRAEKEQHGCPESCGRAGR